jgi:hypothetical protein
MTRPDKIKYGLIAVLSLIVILLLVKVFRGGGAGDVDKELQMTMQVVRAKDETIKAVQRERDAYVLMNAEKDKSIVAHEQIDSVLRQALIDNQKKYQVNEKKSADVVKHVSDLDHDALLREITEY